MRVQQISNRGRKSVIGNVVVNDGRLAFFGGHAECPCGQKFKILLSMDDIRALVTRFGGGTQLPIGERITRRLARHYGL